MLVEEVEEENNQEFEVEEDSSALPQNLDDQLLTEDCLFYTSLPSQAEFIRTTQTTSQRLLKHIKRTLKLRQLSLSILKNLKISSLNSPLTPCLIGRSGIMQLSLYQMQSPQIVKYIHFHPMNRRS